MQRANWSLGGPRENAAAYITVSHRSGTVLVTVWQRYCLHTVQCRYWTAELLLFSRSPLNVVSNKRRKTAWPSLVLAAFLPAMRLVNCLSACCCCLLSIVDLIQLQAGSTKTVLNKLSQAGIRLDVSRNKPMQFRFINHQRCLDAIPNNM